MQDFSILFYFLLNKRKGKKNPDKEQESVSIGKKGEYY